jgi:hypothetical protein
MRSYLSLAAALLVVFGLALPARAIDPKYLPPNAEMALTVNLKQILGSELFKDKKLIIDPIKALIQAKIDQLPVAEQLEKTGFNLMRDLHSVTVTTDGSKDLDSMFIAIEGEFDTPKWVEVAKAAAKENGELLRVTKMGAVNIFEITPQANEKTIYTGIINDSVLVIAPTRDKLNATIARVTTGRGVGIKPALRQLVATTNEKQSFSMVMSGKGLANGIANARKLPGGDIGAAVQDLDGLAFSITLTKDISFQLAATAKDEESAKELASKSDIGLRGVRGFLNLKAKDDDRMQLAVDIFNTLKVSTQGPSVILRGIVSQANLDRILAFGLQ